MIITRPDLLAVIFDAVDEFNKPRDREEWLRKSEDTELVGSMTLDSLSFVDFIVALEGKIAERFDVSITIADERAMSERNSPFRNIESLVDYLVKLLGQKV